MTPRLAAKLCNVVYQSGPAAKYAAGEIGLANVEFYDRAGTQVLCGTLGDKTTVIVFRGTKIDPVIIGWKEILGCRVLRTIAASMTDIRFDVLAARRPWQGPGEVHGGFKAALEHVSQHIHSYVGRHRSSTVQVMGHSLGGGLAHLCAGVLGGELRDLTQIYVTTFGCPAVGNAEACRWIEGHCRSITNWEYCSDIVPRLLKLVPGYHRPGNTEYVDRNGKRLYHATRLRKLIDRSILRGRRFAAGGIRAAFLQEIEHHRMRDWLDRDCLGEVAA